jgi:hypothetical protein
VSPSHNSSPIGWSPIGMPRRRSLDLSPSKTHRHRGHRHPAAFRLDWTPPLAPPHQRGSSGTRPDLCSSPEPETNWRPAPARARHASTSHLSGTVRGNKCVSRTWESRTLPHHQTPRHTASAGTGGKASISVGCEDRGREVEETLARSLSVRYMDGQRRYAYLTTGGLISVIRRPHSQSISPDDQCTTSPAEGKGIVSPYQRSGR